MDNELSEQIRRRIAELAAERAQRAQQAQRVDFGYATAIGELERLLAQVETPPPPPPPEIDLSALQEGETNATAS